MESGSALGKEISDACDAGKMITKLQKEQCVQNARDRNAPASAGVAGERTIDIPSPKVGQLIGPKGATLKQMQSDTGAKINIDRDTSKCTITGSEEAVEAAFALINGIVNPLFEMVECTDVSVTHVVGPGGGTIKQLQSDTGAKISTEGVMVRVEGTEAQIKAAVDAIKAILENQANPDYTGPEGSRLRDEAQAAAEKRSRLMDEASACFDAGDKSKGHELQAEAKEAGEEMKRANAAAAEAIIAFNNDPAEHGNLYLDLHGLLLEEAMKAVETKLAAMQELSKDGDVVMELITGAGHHSAAGKGPAIKPAVEASLKEKGLIFEAKSAGSFTVRFNVDR